MVRTIQSILAQRRSAENDAPRVLLYSDRRIYNKQGVSIVRTAEGTSMVRDYAFRLSRHLKWVNISSTVRYIGRESFQCCAALKTVQFAQHSSLKKIGHCAFEGSGLIEMEIPSSIVCIESAAFADCDSLRKLTICSKMLDLSDNLCEGCTKLSSVDLSQAAGLWTIPKKAFLKCYALTEITLPSDLKAIDVEAFAECDNLKTIDLSSTNVWTIGRSAFCGCNNLQVIRLSRDISSVASSAFAECYSLYHVVKTEGVSEEIWVSIISGINAVNKDAFDKIGIDNNGRRSMDTYGPLPIEMWPYVFCDPRLLPLKEKENMVDIWGDDALETFASESTQISVIFDKLVKDAKYFLKARESNRGAKQLDGRQRKPTSHHIREVNLVF